MMLTALLLFSAGFVAGLGAWWFSLDRRRGKEVRKLAQAHHLPVDAVHDASIRALRYGFAEDFTFLVSKAHPRADGKQGSVLQSERGISLEPDISSTEEDPKVP
jgi:hypothetical protein